MTTTPPPVCRWCGGQHSIADCPAVLGAFGPVRQVRPPARRTAKPKHESNLFNRIKRQTK